MRRFGLLGLFTQRVQSLRYKPRWRCFEGGQWIPTNTHDYRSKVVGGWKRKNRPAWDMDYPTGVSFEVRPVTLDVDDIDGKLVEFPPEVMMRPPSAVITPDVYSDEIEELPLGRAVGQYFADVTFEEADLYAYPQPQSVRFWAEYSEPVGEFRSSIARFQQIVTCLVSLKPGLTWDQVNLLQPEERQNLQSAWDDMQNLSPDGSVIHLNKESEQAEPYEVWVFYSLLGMAAYQLRRDILGGQRVFQCARPGCGINFIKPIRNRRKYCTEKCNNTMGKAVRRGRGLSN